MKIAYSVMGEGRGHVSRLVSIAPLLDAELMIFAGGDAYKFLRSYNLMEDQYKLVGIPTIKYTYGDGQIKFIRTVRNNLKYILDFKSYILLGYLNGFRNHSTTKLIEQKVNDFKPDLIVSDSEFFIQHIRRDVPLVSFDRYGKIAFCESTVETSVAHQIQRSLNNFSYKSMMGNVDKIITTSFYDAAPKEDYAGFVKSLGPIIRKEVRAVTPSEGDHVVVYATHKYIYTQRFLSELKKLKRKVYVYGSSLSGSSDNLEFCSINPEAFIEHISSSAYIVSTPGNMLLSEMGYLGKRMILLWTNPLEQRESALYGEKLGIGKIVNPETVTAVEIEAKVALLNNFPRLKDCSHNVAEAIKSSI